MSAWIEMIGDDQADGRLKELLDKARTPHGTVDTVMRVHSLRPETMNGHVYLAKLQTFLDNQRRYHGHYSDYDQAAEIVQQAHQHDRYKLVAATLLSKLQDYKNASDLPIDFTPHRLITTLETRTTRASLLAIRNMRAKQLLLSV